MIEPMFGADAVVCCLVPCLLGAGLILLCIKKVTPGKVGVRVGIGGLVISDTAILRIPLVTLYQEMDITVQKMEIELKGHNGVRCKDNIRADVVAIFHIRVNPSVESIRQVAIDIGCERATDIDTLNEIFRGKFIEGMKAVAIQTSNEDLLQNRTIFKEEIINAIGQDLNGYVLEDLNIEHLEQTAMEDHDPNDILDAKGIKKIARLTAQSQEDANDIIREMEVKQKEQAVAAEIEKLELAQQNAEALAKKQRELVDDLKKTFPDKNKIKELRSQIAQLEEQDSSKS